MRVVGLVSGGKDSCYNMMQCIAAGHEIVALANIEPKGKDELDSYMYQTVGHQGISMIAEAMQLPLFRRSTKGNALEKGRMYQETQNDEVEDLYDLLKDVQEKLHIEGVAVGAILSDYQRVRVENVCGRLNLVSLAYLWRRDQTELLQEMISNKIFAIVIKVAALGLEPGMLGKPLWALQPILLRAKEKFGLNVCGEGGEYETFTLDCPLFKSKIVIDETQVIVHSNDPIAPAGYINLLKFHLEPKCDTSDSFIYSMKTCLDFISDINECSYSDLSEASETELEAVVEGKARRQSVSESSTPTTLVDNNSNLDITSAHSCPSIIVEGAVVSEDETDSKEFCSRARTYSTSITYPITSIEYEMEKEDIEDHGSINSNDSGWHWIGGVVGKAASPDSGMEEALNKLCSLLSSNGLSLNNVCSVTLYIRNMDDYSTLNKCYVNIMNFPNPPSRGCVECPLPRGVGVILEALAYEVPNKETDVPEKFSIHVQGISHWAPANIGPYSQAIRIGDIINVSGQIPLIPGNMKLVDGSDLVQCRLALRHVQRILNAVDSKSQIRDVVQAVCYVTHPHLIVEARRQWERHTNNAIVDYVVVPKLPRNSPIEWHVWAHRHNSRFEYEETGCNIGEYKIAIRRRWNYENNVSATVCYVATASLPSSAQLTHLDDEIIQHHKTSASLMTVEEIVKVIYYCIKRLFNECNIDNKDTAIVYLRIFYKVSISPRVQLLFDALKTVKKTTIPKLVFTVVPVICLHNPLTFLSLSLVRHEST